MNTKMLAETYALYMLSQMPNAFIPGPMFVSGGSPIYTPRRGKFKGYMRDNRNWGKKR